MVLGALAGAAIGAACRDGGSSPVPPGRALDVLAERYVRVALQLAQHQPDLVETYLGPAEWRPGPRVPVAGLLGEVIELDAVLTGFAVLRPTDALERDRARYLAGQVRGLRTAARRLSGETMRFADEARDAFGIEWTPRPSEDIGAAGGELEARLPGKGPLPARYAAFRQQHALASGLVLPVFRAAIAECRTRVAAHVTLPDGESLTVDPLEGGGFEARAIYDGAFRTRVAIDPLGRSDLARIVWLAAHETYPGHHLQHVLAERDMVRGRGWTERTLLPGFGPHVLAGEGAAEAGAALLLDPQTFTDVCASLARQARPSNDAVADLAAVQRAVTALDEVVPLVAQAYLDGDIGSEAAAARLRDEALVPDAPQLLGIIERQRTRILAYPVGRRLVTRIVLEQPPANQWTRLREIATTMVASNDRRS
jgi:hypothetical protein